MKNENKKPIAILTIHRASKMDQRTVLRVQNWLRKLAKDFKKEKENYANKFRARLF